MLKKHNSWNSLGFAVGVCALAISTGLGSARAEDGQEASAVAQEASATDARASAAIIESQTPESAPAETKAEPSSAHPLNQVEVRPAGQPAESTPERPYFIEFRARSAYNYGHTFVVHGHVGEPITRKSVVGLHPAGDSVPWTIGHFIPVPSETGWSDGDVGYNDKYIIAKYRVYLTPGEYRVILAKMRQMQANTPMWHAAVYNCNAFTGDIAAFMGLSHPFHWLMPKDYVNGIKQAAGGRTTLPSSWLASIDPAAARQQYRDEVAARSHQSPSAHQQAASSAHQQAAPAPSANTRRRQPSGTQAAARPQMATPTPSSYAIAQ
jgi:hypothetical protein